MSRPRRIRPAAADVEPRSIKRGLGSMNDISARFKMAGSEPIQKTEAGDVPAANPEITGTSGQGDRISTFRALVEAVDADEAAAGDVRLGIVPEGVPVAREYAGTLAAPGMVAEMLMSRTTTSAGVDDGETALVNRAAAVASLLAAAAATGKGNPALDGARLDSEAMKLLSMVREGKAGIQAITRLMDETPLGGRGGREPMTGMIGRADGTGPFAGPAASSLQTGASLAATFSAEPSPVPVRNNFDGALAQQVRWLVDRGMEMAELRLEPPRLGSLGVRVRLEGEQAVLHFQSAHASVRDAVEAAVPRLRELLSETGIDLADVQVGRDDDARDRSGDSGAGAGESDVDRAGMSAESDEDAASRDDRGPMHASIGIFDGYA